LKEKEEKFKITFAFRCVRIRAGVETIMEGLSLSAELFGVTLLVFEKLAKESNSPDILISCERQNLYIWQMHS
jgi:hypothetical protein